MIRIEKSANMPDVLRKEGVEAADALSRAFVSNPDAYKSGVGKSNKEIKRFKFHRKIYAHADVVRQLRADQNHKCCFCEASFLDERSGDVEHYRPKSAVKGSNKAKLIYPGYYWLAYEWQNLLLACADCNQKYKRNHFALEREEERMADHTQAGNLSKEHPLLLDPTREDPSLYITFIKGEAVAIRDNPRGKYTIRTLQLNRMVAAREAFLLDVKKNRLLCQIDENDPDHLACASALFDGFPEDEIKALVQQSKKFMARATTPEGKFSLCVRANFPDLNVPES